MRSFVVLAALAACTHGGGGKTQTLPAPAWNAPDNLAHVPADTPYVVTELEPPPADVRAALWAPVDTRVIAALEQFAAIPLSERAAMPERDRALMAIVDDLRGTDATKWWQNAGLAPGGRFVIYGLGVWPVLRIAVADAGKLRGLLARAMQVVPKAAAKQLGGVAYWQLVDDGMAIVVAVLDTELVIAMTSEPLLERLLPLVLGTRLPPRSLRDVRDLPEQLARFHLVPSLTGYVASARLADAVTGELSPFAGRGNALATQACRDDFARIAAVVPRVAFGYRALDMHHVDGVLAAELDPALAAQLAKLHVNLPALPATALVAMSVGLDLDGAIELVRGWQRSLAAAPFACPALATFGRGLLDATRALDRPLPPEAHGMRGAELVVTDARPDPPSGTGFAIFAGDQIALAVVHALQQLPGMQGMQIGPDGRPYEVPLGPLFAMAGMAPIPTFVATRAGRAALAVGPNARDDVVAALGAANGEHTPILRLVWDIARFQTQFPSYFREQQAAALAKFSSLIMTLDVEGGALVLDANVTWARRP